MQIGSGRGRLYQMRRTYTEVPVANIRVPRVLAGIPSAAYRKVCTILGVVLYTFSNSAESSNKIATIATEAGATTIDAETIYAEHLRGSTALAHSPLWRYYRVRPVEISIADAADFKPAADTSVQSFPPNESFDLGRLYVVLGFPHTTMIDGYDVYFALPEVVNDLGEAIIYQKNHDEGGHLRKALSSTSFCEPYDVEKPEFLHFPDVYMSYPGPYVMALAPLCDAKYVAFGGEGMANAWVLDGLGKSAKERYDYAFSLDSSPPK